MAHLNPADSTAMKMTLPGPPSGTPPTPHKPSADANAPQMAKTDLGTQTVNGVAATGTKMTVIVPAGAMGNPHGILYRNGVELPEPTPGKDADLTVPPNKYFVLGDNRSQARDSRTWGLIDRSDVIGQPKYIYGSLAPDAADIKAAPATSGDENILEPAHPPVRRWERVLKGL